MSRALGCAISGGLAISLGILAAYGIAALLLLPLEAMRDYMLEPPGYFRQLLETLLMFFASGAFWALVGLTFATLTNSRYMAYASPFVLFYLLVILYERYFDKLYILCLLYTSRKTFDGAWVLYCLLYCFAHKCNDFSYVISVPFYTNKKAYAKNKSICGWRALCSRNGKRLGRNRRIIPKL